MKWVKWNFTRYLSQNKQRLMQYPPISIKKKKEKKAISTNDAQM